MTRYVLHPGWVRNRATGYGAFVGGPRSARIYGVDIKACVFGDVPEYEPQEGDIHLRPSIDDEGNITVTADE